MPIVRARESLFGDPEYELARAMRPTAYPRRVAGRLVDRLGQGATRWPSRRTRNQR